MPPASALLVLLAAGRSDAVPWAGCVAEPDRARVLLACPDDSVCTVAESRLPPDEAITAFEATIHQVGSRVVLREEGSRGVRRGQAPGEPDVLVAADPVRPGVTRLVSCVLAGPDARRGEARFAELHARGLPPLQDLLARWAVPSLAGRPLVVPQGCVPAVDATGGRVDCGLDQLVVATLTGTGPAADLLAAAGGRLDALARARGVRIETSERPCTVAGVPATCRRDVLHSEDPLETPCQLVGAWDGDGRVHLARCAWAGDPDAPPAVCTQVIRPGR